jgi:N6-adenosine-specific RNA methylase IME4
MTKRPRHTKTAPKQAKRAAAPPKTKRSVAPPKTKRAAPPPKSRAPAPARKRYAPVVSGEVLSAATPDLSLAASASWSMAEVPPERTEQEWKAFGEGIGRIERMVGFAIGDWWNRGEQWRRTEIVTADGWTGPTYGTCRTYGTIAAKFPPSQRNDKLAFGIYQAVASQPEERIPGILDRVVQEVEKGEAPTVREVRAMVKREIREERELQMAEITREASRKLGHKLYGVIYADPPWRFEPYSRDTGMDRAADNHYGTMPTDDICRMEVPAAQDAVLFLWRTAPMLEDARRVMQAWGFQYKSEIIWGKPKAGTGYWARNQHEVLMIGTKGAPVAPAQGSQPGSLQMLPVGRHSAKPEAFYAIIEKMYPHVPKIEMFARRWRDGWDAWGNEARTREDTAA